MLTESYDQGLSNKPSYMLSPFLVLEISLKQSKSTKHLIGFLRHCIVINPVLDEDPVTLYVYPYLLFASSVPTSLMWVLGRSPVKSHNAALSSQWHDVFSDELAILIRSLILVSLLLDGDPD